MKYSLKWLNDYCAISVKPEELAHIITFLGLEVESIEEYKDDYILDVDVTPDMAHCLSMVGLAREIAIGTGGQFKIPKPKYKTETRDDPGIEVIVDNPDLCPLYIGRVIEGVTLGAGPGWMGERLEAAGMRPLDVIVDITNYVMLETGQPFHAFDKSKLAGGKIIIRRAKPGEPITLLDETELELCEDDLVIADAERPIAIAGVMGGIGSEIDANTEDIVLEIAHFEPTSVRRTAKRYDLATESSYRFERGVNPDGVLAASDRAVALFEELAGGTVIAPTATAGETDWPMLELALRTERVNTILGTRLTTDEVGDILNRLDMDVEPAKDGVLAVKPPGYRRDLTREIDIIEEVGRVYGFNEIDSTLPTDDFMPPFHIEREEIFNTIRDTLVGSGFYEAYTDGFTDAERLVRYGVAENAVAMQNPLSANLTHLRPAIWPMLAEVADRNGRYGETGVLLFELGTVFYGAKKAKLELYDIERKGVGEEVHLGLIGGGDYGDYHWQEGQTKIDFFFIKGVLARLSEALRLPEPIFDGEKVIIGDIAGTFRYVNVESLGYDLVAVELDITPLLKSGVAPFSSLEPIPRFPGVERDLALLVNATLPSAELIEALEGSDDTLESVGIFDLYEGKGIPGSKKSIGIRLRYRADDRTLTDEEANEARERALRIIDDKFNAELRQ
ncbi:MAG: phenylalanine--tRNA ligase subunit beta [bacterium]|nr:phenylalanine--tRNA ligase subunit beta [bacterium]